MRITPATIALAAVLAVTSSAGNSQQKVSAPVHQLSALSIQWQGKGDLARKVGNLDAANDAYESAVAADPQNRGAYVALAEIARAQGLQGKAIRFYGEALAGARGKRGDSAGARHARAHQTPVQRQLRGGQSTCCQHQNTEQLARRCLAGRKGSRAARERKQRSKTLIIRSTECGQSRRNHPR